MGSFVRKSTNCCCHGRSYEVWTQDGTKMFSCSYNVKTNLYDPKVQLTRSNYQCYQMITASPWYVRDSTASARRDYLQTISLGRFFYPIFRDLGSRCTPYLTTSFPWLCCAPARRHLIVGVIVAVIILSGINIIPSGSRFFPTRGDTLNYSFLKVSDFRGQDFRIADSMRDRSFKSWA